MEVCSFVHKSCIDGGFTTLSIKGTLTACSVSNGGTSEESLYQKSFRQCGGQMVCSMNSDGVNILFE